MEAIAVFQGIAGLVVKVGDRYGSILATSPDGCLECDGCVTGQAAGLGIAGAPSTVRQWVEEGAAVYVCGSLAGMAPDVDATLRRILGEDKIEALRTAGRYRRDVY